MAVQNQGLAFDAMRLSQAFREQKAEVSQRNTLLIAALLGIFGAYFTSNYVIVYRRALRSLADSVANVSASASYMPEILFTELMECTGGKLSDDLALLCITLKGGKSVGSWR